MKSEAIFDDRKYLLALFKFYSKSLGKDLSSETALKYLNIGGLTSKKIKFR